MVSTHSRSFFGQTTGLIVNSNSKKEDFIFFKMLKKKEEGFTEQMGERYRQLVKEWMFSNPKGFTSDIDYITDNDKGFETHTFDKFMRIRYNLQLHLYISMFLHAEDESLPVNALQDKHNFNTKVFRTLLGTTALTSQN
ncbi:MAG: hypothetical protein GF311_25865, partial [Candidatus Lokiarchaeota archaeon]|nr:hypothetical protein [Candidatus Lokiarchaeota archaeon]